MAIMMKCDACGKIYEPYNTNFEPDKNSNSIKLLSHDPYVNHTEPGKRIDLCLPCMTKVLAVIRLGWVEDEK